MSELSGKSTNQGNTIKEIKLMCLIGRKQQSGGNKLKQVEFDLP
jgi:hypothetical protein